MASGILYHLKDPVDFLHRVSFSTRRMFIWTHYFEPDLCMWHRSLSGLLQKGKWDYNNPIIKKVDNDNYRYVKQLYGDALGWSGFCGGTDVYSRWLFKEDLLKLLRHLGFSQVEIAFDAVDHPNGPSFCLLCEK